MFGLFERGSGEVDLVRFFLVDPAIEFGFAFGWEVELEVMAMAILPAGELTRLGEGCPPNVVLGLGVVG